MRALPLTTARAIELIAFIPAAAVDPLRIGPGYYLQPQGAVAAKPYLVLRHALQRASKIAIARYAWHGRERLGLLRVRGDVIALHGLLWPDETRDPAAVVPPPVTLDEDEIDEAMALIEAMTRDDLTSPEFTDRYTEALHAVIEAKQEDRQPRYGVQLASEWPEMRGRRPPKTVSDPTAARLRARPHADRDRGRARLPRGRPPLRRAVPAPGLDPEIYHPIGSGEAVIPDAQRGSQDGQRCDTAGVRGSRPGHHGPRTPRRQAARVRALLPLRALDPGAPPAVHGQKPELEDWRLHYPLFPRLLFVPDGTGPAGVENRVTALCAAARQLAPSRFLQDVPIIAASLADLLHRGPSAPVWRPVREPDQRVRWTVSGHRQT
nr:Ku protein [Streptomyces sp. OV198]